MPVRQRQRRIRGRLDSVDAPMGRGWRFRRRQSPQETRNTIATEGVLPVGAAAMDTRRRIRMGDDYRPARCGECRA
jgi:hypothetical protein